MAKNATRNNSRPGSRNTRPVRGRQARRGLPPVAWLALGGLVLVVVGLFFVRQSLAGPTNTAPAAAIQVTGKPKLAVDRASIDFGRVPLDQPVKAVFKLTNVGDKPLTLAGVPVVEALKGC